MYYSANAFNLHPNILQSKNYWFSFPFLILGLAYAPQGKYITGEV